VSRHPDKVDSQMSGHLVKRFAAFRDSFLVCCVGVEGPKGCLDIRKDENVCVVMF